MTYAVWPICHMSNFTIKIKPVNKGVQGTEKLILRIEVKRVANQLETEIEPGRRFDSTEELINYLSQR